MLQDTRLFNSGIFGEWVVESSPGSVARSKHTGGVRADERRRPVCGVAGWSRPGGARALRAPGLDGDSQDGRGNGAALHLLARGREADPLLTWGARSGAGALPTRSGTIRHYVPNCAERSDTSASEEKRARRSPSGRSRGSGSNLDIMPLLCHVREAGDCQFPTRESEEGLAGSLQGVRPARGGLPFQNHL
jgi:hypothetical protein